MRRFRLTKATVDAELKKKPKARIVWDQEIPGFGLRIRKSTTGLRGWFVFAYRAPGNRTVRWLTLGEHGRPYTADTAHEWAKEKRRLLDDGMDPGAQARDMLTIPTLEAYVPRYLDVKANRTKPDPPKASTIVTDRGNLERICRMHPRIAAKPLHTITPTDIRTVVDRDDKKSAGNRWLAVLRHLFNTAAGDTAAGFSLRTTRLGPDTGPWQNPCKDVSAYTEPARMPEISDEHLVKLFGLLDRYSTASDKKAIKSARAAAQKRPGRPRPAALVFEHEPYIATMIKVQALTGARISEIRTAQWSWLVITSTKPRAGMLRLPDSKEGGAKDLMLSPEVLGLIEALPRIRGCDFIFPGQSRKAPLDLSAVDHWWSRHRKEAGLDAIPLGGDKVRPMRLHDLRHNVAAVLIGQGSSLAEVGEMLGHKSEATTKRYASLMAKAKQARAANVASAIMMKAAM